MYRQSSFISGLLPGLLVGLCCWLVPANARAGLILGVDFGVKNIPGLPDQIQSGFQDFSENFGDLFNIYQSSNEYNNTSLIRNFGDIRVMIAYSGSKFRFLSFGNSVAHPLLGDFLYSQQSTSILIFGLKPGVYQIETFHHTPGSLNISTLNLNFRNDGGAHQPIATNFAPSTDDAPTSVQSVAWQFTQSNASFSSDIQITGPGATMINGFTITQVPEPGAMALVGLVVGALAARIGWRRWALSHHEKLG